MAKKKHKTPKGLDYLFERHVINKKQYADFWDGYWGEHGKRNRNRYVDRFVSDIQIEIPFPKRRSGTLTTSRATAEDQAKQIGGYVVRRNSKGRFSRTGSRYQAVVRRKK